MDPSLIHLFKQNISGLLKDPLVASWMLDPRKPSHEHLNPALFDMAFEWRSTIFNSDIEGVRILVPTYTSSTYSFFIVLNHEAVPFFCDSGLELRSRKLMFSYKNKKTEHLDIAHLSDGSCHMWYMTYDDFGARIFSSMIFQSLPKDPENLWTSFSASSFPSSSSSSSFSSFNNGSNTTTAATHQLISSFKLYTEILPCNLCKPVGHGHGHNRDFNAENLMALSKLSPPSHLYPNHNHYQPRRLPCSCPKPPVPDFHIRSLTHYFNKIQLHQVQNLAVSVLDIPSNELRFLHNMTVKKVASKINVWSHVFPKHFPDVQYAAERIDLRNLPNSNTEIERLVMRSILGDGDDDHDDDLKHHERWKGKGASSWKGHHEDDLLLSFPAMHPQRHGVKWVCPDCQQGFARASDLQKHALRNHDGDLLPFECVQCAKRFKRHSALLRHRASVHEQRKNYRCLNCAFPFFQKSDLERHRRRGCVLQQIQKKRGGEELR